MHLDPRDDPYLQGGESASDSSVEDFEVKPTDNVVLAARNEDDVSHLEVYVYELDAGGESNLYVHHDIMLPAFPLTLAWTDFRPQSGGAKGSLVAVGAMSPAIELWDLDVLDAVEPVAVLGGVAGPEEVAGAGLDKKEKKKAKKKARKKAGKLRGGSHEDAVMALSWNPVFRNGLASGSADGTAKLWDLERGACHATLRHHAGKVQAVAWNAHEGHVLLTAAFDKRACVVDARAPGGDVPTWELTADVEAVAWDPTRPTAFYASTEDGLVACYDARVGPGGGALFRLQAHDSACCSLSVNAALPGLVATAGTDKKVKLWDVRDDKPGLIVAEDLKCGAVFTAGFAASDPLLLAAGGAKGLLSIWDVSTSAAVQKRYAGEIKSLRG
ncbi:unnamed protein product [Pedinophyceae sp. YPF-701]|nr:unnamed protein product [Pedinophyceae sp. YPF-701]